MLQLGQYRFTGNSVCLHLLSNHSWQRENVLLGTWILRVLNYFQVKEHLKTNSQWRVYDGTVGEELMKWKKPWLFTFAAMCFARRNITHDLTPKPLEDSLSQRAGAALCLCVCVCGSYHIHREVKPAQFLAYMDLIHDDRLCVNTTDVWRAGGGLGRL